MNDLVKYLWYFFLASLGLGIWIIPIVIVVVIVTVILRIKKPEWFK